jgi:hypothetical protein
MAGRQQGADQRIRAVVAVEGRSRLVPLPPGANSTAAESTSVVEEGTALW